MLVQFHTSLGQFYDRHYSRRRRYALAVLVPCVSLARLIRDLVLSRIALDPERRAELADNIEAWRRLLSGQWRQSPVSHGQPKS